MTIFIGFIPGATLVYDLPPLAKNVIIPANAQVPDTLMDSENGNLDDLLSLERKRKLGGSVETQRGARSYELLRMLEQQLRFLYKCNFNNLGATQEWFPIFGISNVHMEPGPTNMHLPRMISLVSDQGSEIVLAIQALKWSGVRCHWTPDHNHRDDNDIKAAGAPIRMAMDVLSKCAIGPFKLGLWHKAICDAAEKLMNDRGALEEYEYIHRP